MSNIITGIMKDLKAIPEFLKAKWKSINIKKLILFNLPYFFVGYFCDKVAWLWRVTEGSNVFDKFMLVCSQMAQIFSNPFLSLYRMDLLIGVGGGIVLKLVVYYKAKNAKKFRHGVEYGSARCGA